MSYANNAVQDGGSDEIEEGMHMPTMPHYMAMGGWQVCPDQQHILQLTKGPSMRHAYQVKACCRYRYVS